jgi:hypothetical protein
MYTLRIKAQGEWYYAGQFACTSVEDKALVFPGWREVALFLLNRVSYLASINALEWRMEKLA